MSDIPSNGGTIAWRVKRAEDDIASLGKDKASKTDLATQGRDIEKLAEKMDSVIKALYLFSLTIAASAIGLAFAILQGGH